MENITAFNTSFVKSLDVDGFQAVLSLEKALNAVANEDNDVTYKFKFVFHFISSKTHQFTTDKFLLTINSLEISFLPLSV